MSLRIAIYVGGLIAAVALILSILGLVGTTTLNSTVSNYISNNGAVPALFSAYDNRSQSVASINTWTPIHFNNHLFTNAGVWQHSLGDKTLLCKRTGIYIVYFSIQAQVNPYTEGVEATSISTSLEPVCKPQHLRYSLRGAQQVGGVGAIKEIPASLTYSSGQNFFLSKQFFINASEGDVFRFEFSSPCKDLTLQPYPQVYAEEPPPVPGSYFSSATLIIV